MPDHDSAPAVSYVMPVLNEAGYLEAAVRSILAQRYPGELELVLALGPSTDGTRDIAARLMAEDPRIRSVENPGVDIPTGLNRAIAASSHPIVIRVDAHTEIPPEYTARGVATLEREGVATVGGSMIAVGRSGIQLAVARAYNSRFGLGGGAYHGDRAVAGPAESAYLGIFRRDVLDAVGGYDESLRRGEDWELNYRIRQGGGVVWLDPALRVSYWPRDTMGKLVRQFYATGVWRGELVRRLGSRNSLRYFAPPALLLGAIATLVLGILVAAGVRPWPVVALLIALGLALVAYLGLLGVAMARSDGSLGERLRFGAVIVAMHLSWGAGFLVGVLRGARDAVDTSRTES